MARTYVTDAELVKLARDCERRGIARACATCGRSLSRCQQWDDLPMRMRKGKPICNACYEQGRPQTNDKRQGKAQPTGGRAMATRINWTQAQPGSDVPLYQEALEMRDAGLSLAEISRELRERHGIEVEPSNMSKQLERYATGKAQPRPDRLNWAAPMREGERPLWEEAQALHDSGLSWAKVTEELKSRYGISVAPNTVSGMVTYHAGKGRRAKGKGEGAERQERPGIGNGQSAIGDGDDPAAEAKAAPDVGPSELLVPGEPLVGPAPRRDRAGAPCLLHLARDGMEIWITARDENEFLVKMEQAQNVMQMVGNG